MKEYRLQYLNDKEFEALSRVNPRYANTKNDAGFADMVTNRIYVRKSGNAVIDQFVTSHEIEEILAKNSAHEDEHKIRHKKGGALRTILPIAAAFVPGIGPVLSAALNVGLNQAAQARHPEELGPPSIGSALMQGASGYFGGKAAGGALSGGIRGGTQAAPGFLSKAAGIASGAGKGAMTALGFGSPIQAGADTLTGTSAIKAPTMAQGFAANQAANPVLSTPVSFGGANYAISGGAKGLTAAAMPAATAALGFQGLPTQAQGAVTPPSAGSAQPTASKLQFQPQSEVGTNFGSAVNNLPTTNPLAPAPAMGAQAGAPGASLGAGGGGISTAGKPSVLKNLLGENWRQTLLGASIPVLGQSAGSMFGATPTPEPFTPEQSALFQETAQMVRQGANVQLNPGQKQAITANYDDALQQARQNLMDRYKMLRPGSDIENDSNFREAMIELESDFAEKKANALAGAQLGLSAQQTQMMGELANMEIGLLSQKAGINYQEAKDFQDMLSSLGFMVAQSGQPIMYTSR